MHTFRHPSFSALRYGHALPEAVLLILIPILAVSPTRDGFRFYQTINFSWACSTLLGVFLTSQLSACYLRCVVVSTRYLEPTGAAALRYDPQRHVPSAETMATAVEKVTSASRLEIVLAALFFILELEISSAWLVGALHGALKRLRAKPNGPGVGGYGTDDVEQWLWGLRHQVTFDSILASFLVGVAGLEGLLDAFAIHPTAYSEKQ